MFRVAAWLAAVAVISAPAVLADEEKLSFKDPQDGMFDMGSFLAKGGFIPMVTPITEPAVGYGAAGGLIFLQRNKEPGSRPDIYALGGMYTESKSWATGGIYAGNWLDGELRTQVRGGYVSLNLKHYGLGDSPQAQDPIAFNLSSLAGGVSGSARIPGTPVYGGLFLIAANAKAELSRPLPFEGDTSRTMVALRPYLQVDTRDNILTPTRGWFAEAGCAFTHKNEINGDGTWFELLDVSLMGFTPIFIPELFLGVNGGAGFSFGNAPFYLRPYVVLRGAPAMRYQGEEIANLEVELRWQFWKRFSLVGFGGAGAAWTDAFDFQRSESVFTGGAGFRYEIARRFGLHMGADFAWGRDGFALYLQFGSAWGRI